jgi:hypothetical protein
MEIVDTTASTVTLDPRFLEPGATSDPTPGGGGHGASRRDEADWRTP